MMIYLFGISIFIVMALGVIVEVEGVLYDPVILFDGMKPILQTLPFKDDPSVLEKNSLGQYMCPAETQQDVDILQKASDQSFKFKNCLFRRHLSAGDDMMCKMEPKPVLTLLTDKETKNKLKCGPHDQYNKYSVGFYICGEKENIAELLQLGIEKNLTQVLSTGHYQTKRVYRICFNSNNKDVFMTEHHVYAIPLFFNSQLDSEKNCPMKLDTDTFFFKNKGVYKDIKKVYKNEKQKDASKEARMVPQRLVPCEHIALPAWRAAVNHYINTAPLWEILVPLMKAIDEGIKRAQINLYLANPTVTDDLQIITRVETVEDQQSNIWYKLVYRVNSNAGILIVIHNDPNNVPKLDHSSTTCDFKSWTKDENLRDAITKEMLKYAECRGVADVTDIFRLSFKIQEYLDLDKLINNGPSKSPLAFASVSNNVDKSTMT